MGQRIAHFLGQHVETLYFPSVQITDVIEILIITVLVYQIMVWIKNTKAWMLLRGIVALGFFILIATLFQMHTILWIVKNAATVMATAAIVVFQPELRRGLEKLGERMLVPLVNPFDPKLKMRFSDATVDEIVDAVFQMSKVKTGALIVVEQVIQLTEYEITGIQMDCIVSGQVLINIFEHNTPLHDGAVIIRNDRIMAATCYLPLSDNMGLSKELGTRHRAAVGMSEVSDALIIVVSEETGQVSYAQGGNLTRDVDEEELRERFDAMRDRGHISGTLLSRWKGRLRDEKDSEK